MGFSGGGSNVLKPHKHSSAVQDGSPLDMNNVTEATLTAGDIVYSDGSALQRLAIGADGLILAVSGSTPSWSASTSNPLIKVSKTYADIATLEMPIYTLPQDAALVNVYTDITSVFDVSTAVTIGDAGDADGFAQASDFTSGTGLSDATRGAYVTSFKTMRSTSGTTAVKAYGFATSAGSVFNQPLTDGANSIPDVNRTEMAQQFNAGHVLVGESICHASFFLDDNGLSPTGTFRSFIRQSDGTVIQESSTTLDATSLTGSAAEYSFAFPDVTLSAGDMITLMADSVTATCQIHGQGTEMTNGKLYQTTTPGSGYSQVVTRELQMTVTYGCAGDTQGAVDFYLQVVD